MNLKCVAPPSILKRVRDYGKPRHAEKLARLDRGDCRLGFGTPEKVCNFRQDSCSVLLEISEDGTRETRIFICTSFPAVLGQ